MRPTELLVFACCLLARSGFADVTLTCDFSKSSDRRAPIYNFWSVRNEIPDYPRIVRQKPPEQNSMNCIRLLGGWAKNGQSQPEEDCCYWDEAKQKYAYRWSKLTDRINGVRSNGYQIHQLVLDNPPWCFQRGLKFGNNQDAGEYPEKDRISTYGNSLPPGDPKAWHEFIQTAVKGLVKTYGRKTVEAWRFRVGTESDYHPHHWSGTKEDYFNHYRNTADAVLSVLPDAKLGAHFLQAGGRNRYGVEFVTWCHQNKVKLDFIGISFYPIYNNPRQIDLERIFEVDFKPFVEARGWKAQLEIPEFSLFTEPAPNIGIGVTTSHSAAFNIMLAQMVYENSIGQVHSWGDKTDAIQNLALGTMVGKDRFDRRVSGKPAQLINKVDGIFAADKNGTSIDALIYNYSPRPEYIKDETVTLSFDVPVPDGARYVYRIVTYDRNNNAHFQFIKKYPLAGKRVDEGGWITNKVQPESRTPTDKNGDFNRILEEPGKSLWRKEEDDIGRRHLPKWSEVKTISTERARGSKNSQLKLTLKISSFSFQKIEFRSTAASEK